MQGPFGRDNSILKILGPIRDELLAPEGVNEMTLDLQRACSVHAAAIKRQAVDKLGYVADLHSRIQRLNVRLAAGND